MKKRVTSFLLALLMSLTLLGNGIPAYAEATGEPVIAEEEATVEITEEGEALASPSDTESSAESEKAEEIAEPQEADEAVTEEAQEETGEAEKETAMENPDSVKADSSSSEDALKVPETQKNTSPTIPIRYDGKHYIIDPEYPDHEFIVYCMNNQLYWPHYTPAMGSTKVPEYAEGYLKPENFKSQQDYDECMRRLAKIMYAGYPYNGEGLYEIVGDSSGYRITEDAFNDLLIAPSVLTNAYPILAHHKFTYSDYETQNKEHLDILKQFDHEVTITLGVQHQTTSNGLTYKEISSMAFFKAAHCMACAEQYGSATPLDIYQDTYHADHFVTEDQAYLATQYAIWLLLCDYEVPDNNIESSYSALSDLLYTYSEGGGLLDRKPSTDEIAIQGDLKFAYDSKDGMWHSPLQIIEPEEYRGIYELELPQGVNVAGDARTVVYGNTEYELVSDHQPMPDETVGIRAEIVWLEQIKQYSPSLDVEFNGKKFQHMVGAVVHNETLDISKNIGAQVGSYDGSYVVAHPTAHAESLYTIVNVDIENKSTVPDAYGTYDIYTPAEIKINGESQLIGNMSSGGPFWDDTTKTFEAVSCQGYEFDKWVLMKERYTWPGGEEISSSTNPVFTVTNERSDWHLVCLWKPITYTVTVSQNPAQSFEYLDSSPGTWGSDVHVFGALKQGYKIVKVVDNNVIVDFNDLNYNPDGMMGLLDYSIKNIQENHSIEVFCERKIQKIIFDSDGGDYTPPVEELPAGEVLTEPTPPSKEGYTFKGWYFDGENEQFDFPGMSFYMLRPWEEESHLVAKWEKNKDIPVTNATLKVIVTVSGSGADPNLEFPFYLSFEGGVQNGPHGDIYLNGGSTEIKVKHGQVITVTGLFGDSEFTAVPLETYGYTVTSSCDSSYEWDDEAFMGGLRSEGTTTVWIDFHKDAPTPPTPPVEEKVGALTVTKTVSGSQGDQNKAFTFTVTLDQNDINGTYGDMTFTDGVAVFTLKHNQSKTAIGLPAGIGYTVEETDNAGYTVTKSNEAGTIQKDVTATAAFENYKGGSGGGGGGGGSSHTPEKAHVTLSATKTLDGQIPTGSGFTFFLSDADGHRLQAKNNQGGSITFDTLTFDKTGTYVYYLTEQAGNAPNVNYDTVSYKVMITVTRPHDYAASVAYEKNGQPYYSIPAFVNATKSAPQTPGTTPSGGNTTPAPGGTTPAVTPAAQDGNTPVTPARPLDAIPKTNDPSHVGLWALLAACSALSLAALMLSGNRRRFRYQGKHFR